MLRQLLTDPAMVMYIVTFFASLYGFCLFAWWWIKNGTATMVYGYITLLLFGIGIAEVAGIYARFYYITDHPYWEEYLQSFCWKFRLMFIFVSIMLINLHMSFRAFIASRNSDEDADG